MNQKGGVKNIKRLNEEQNGENISSQIQWILAWKIFVNGRMLSLLVKEKPIIYKMRIWPQ